MIQVNGEKRRVVRRDFNEGLSHKRLKQFISYCPETGGFKRLDGYKVKKGCRAGGLDALGYLKIKLDGFTYLGHRLAWFYMHGKWPADEIDHINNNPSDNRLVNLREATPSQNKANRMLPRHNTSGCKGVSYYTADDIWVVRFLAGGKNIYIGRFKEKEEAIQAYKDSIHKYHEEFTNLR